MLYCHGPLSFICYKLQDTYHPQLGSSYQVICYKMQVHVAFVVYLSDCQDGLIKSYVTLPGSAVVHMLQVIEYMSHSPGTCLTVTSPQINFSPTMSSPRLDVGLYSFTWDFLHLARSIIHQGAALKSIHQVSQVQLSLPRVWAQNIHGMCTGRSLFFHRLTECMSLNNCSSLQHSNRAITGKYTACSQDVTPIPANRPKIVPKKLQFSASFFRVLCEGVVVCI